MGTKTVAVAHQQKHEVSNPLGWDGDALADNATTDASDVSNPLGWDGDLTMIDTEGGPVNVSNPLGWDGDAEKHNFPSVSTPSFLIH